MKIGTRPLLVLHGDTTFRARLRELAGLEYAVSVLPDWTTLAEAVRTSPPSAVVVVDPYAEGPHPTRFAPGFHALLHAFPSIPVFAAVRVTPAHAADLAALADCVVADIIAIEHDDTVAALRTRFRSALGRPLKHLLDTLMPVAVPARTRAILDAAAEVVSAGRVSSDLARALGLSRRTLLRWTDRAELPPPRRLLAWIRILLAASLLDDAGRRVVDVATACGYSADPGLRRVTTNFLGQSPASLRHRGAFKIASAAFLKDLEGYRGTRS